MTPEAQRARARLKMWWILWAAILAGPIVIYLAYVRGKPLPANLPPEKALTGLIGVVPLFVSIVIRWLVLPRFRTLAGAFPMFLAGLVLAEGCGLLGIFLGGPYRDDLFILGVLGIAQYVPLFARHLLEPRGAGFIPNN
jgi:hypothetical protein